MSMVRIAQEHRWLIAGGVVLGLVLGRDPDADDETAIPRQRHARGHAQQDEIVMIPHHPED